jgi:hypothetical protein
MYLVTIEADDGTWCDAPEGFDSEDQAKQYATTRIRGVHKSWIAAIYRCDLVTTLTGDAVGSVSTPEVKP